MDIAASSVLVSDPHAAGLFERGFDRTAFPFSHTLHQSPYFTYPALLDLANRVQARPNRFHIEENDTTPGKGWSVRQPSKSLEDNLRDIADTHSFVMLKRVHEEPEYGQMLKECTDELSDLAKIDMRKHYRDGLMTILITSPHRVTPYHIDSEANLLMQIHGSKAVYIFDGNDREILPATELERFWTGDIKAATYREQLQDRAWRFDLAPGLGVQNPVIFPHWVQNGPEVSISLSINYKRVTDNTADAFRINSRMRKVGLRPKEPGQAHLVDHTKGLVYRTFRNVKHTVDQWKERAQ
jgi:hypothetical protein